MRPVQYQNALLQEEGLTLPLLLHALVYGVGKSPVSDRGPLSCTFASPPLLSLSVSIPPPLSLPPFKSLFSLSLSPSTSFHRERERRTKGEGGEKRRKKQASCQRAIEAVESDAPRQSSDCEGLRDRKKSPTSEEPAFPTPFQKGPRDALLPFVKVATK